MFVIHFFFLTAMCQAEFILFASAKNQKACTFFLQTDYSAIELSI